MIKLSLLEECFAPGVVDNVFILSDRSKFALFTLVQPTSTFVTAMPADDLQISVVLTYLMDKRFLVVEAPHLPFIHYLWSFVTSEVMILF